jgi:hypothetical protein
MTQTTQEQAKNQMKKCNKKKMKDGVVMCKEMTTSKMMMTQLGK